MEPIAVPLWFLATIATVLPAAAFFGGWAAKPHPFKGKTIIVGKRPSTGTAFVNLVKPTRGMYHWTEKGGFAADIHLDNAYLWNEAHYGGKLVEVDLDTTQVVKYVGHKPKKQEVGTMAAWDGRIAKPVEAGGKPEDGAVDVAVATPVRYEGACENDGESVTVAYRGKNHVLGPVWRRLTGERLYAIRKDTRLKQLASIGTTLWEFLTKALPILAISTVVLLLVALGVMGFVATRV